MISKSKTYDVFISYSAADAQLAASAADALRHNGLEPFTESEIDASQNLSDAVWEALSESKALIAILSRSELSPSMGVEIGAAQAWAKPIYAVVTDPASVRLPSSLVGVRVFAAGGIEDIILDIVRSADTLSEEDRHMLSEVYVKNGTSVDRFALDHQQLRRVTERFNKKAGKNIPGERLLWEMLTMRKRGVLPRIVTPRKAAPSRNSV